MKVKVKDVAELAGVSPTTASLVLNHKECRVADETKERIFRVAEELKYQQENYGIFQGFKKVKSIGLIVPDIGNPFYSRMAQDISKQAWEWEYTVFQCNINQEFLSFRNAVECLIGKNTDGVILIPPEKIDKEGIKLVKSLQNSRIPMVLLDRAVYTVFCDFVTADNKLGGRIATEHLIQNGHSRIGVLLGGEDSYTAKKRLEGYREVLSRHKIAFDEHLLYQGEYSVESGYQGATYFHKMGVDAIFAANDQLAEGIYRYAGEQDLRIGTDLSVVGYDDTERGRWLNPPLTSVNQSGQGMAEKAVELLIQRIQEEDGETPAKNFYFTPVLAERESVALKSCST